MPIEIKVRSARRQKIRVEVIPPQWQEFILLESDQSYLIKTIIDRY